MKNVILFVIVLLIFAFDGYAQPVKRIWSKGTSVEVGAEYPASIIFSPDGKYFASGGNDRSVKIWNSLTGEYGYKLWHDGYVYTLDWSPDNKRVAFGGPDSYLYIYCLENDTIEKIISGYDQGPCDIEKVIFSESGKFIAYKTSSHSFKIYNFIDSSIIISKSGPFSIWYNKISFSHSEKYFAFLTPYKNLTLLVDLIISSMSKSDTLAIFKDLDPKRTYFEFLPEYFVIVDSNNINYYNIPDFQLIKSQPLPNRGFTFSKDGSYALVVDSDSSLSLWNLWNHKKLYSANVFNADPHYIYKAISPDNKYFALSGNKISQLPYNDMQLIECFDLISGKKLWNTFDRFNSFNASQCVTISPDNKYLLASNDDGGLTLLKPENGELIKILNPGKYYALVALNSDFSNDSIHFAFAYYSSDNKEEENVLIYNINNLDTTDTMFVGNGGSSCLKYSPDGKYLAVGLRKKIGNYDSDYLLRYYDILSKKLTWESHLTDMATSMSFSGDGSLLAVGTNSWWVYIMDVSTGKIHRSFRNWEYNNIINCVALNREGT